MSNNCVLCQTPAMIVFAGKFAKVIVPEGNLFAAGQLQIVLRSHAGLDSIDLPMIKEVLALTKLCQTAMNECLKSDGYNIYSCSEAHFAQMIIPRFADDVSWLDTIGGSKPFSASAISIYQQLQQKLQELGA